MFESAGLEMSAQMLTLIPRFHIAILGHSSLQTPLKTLASVSAAFVQVLTGESGRHEVGESFGDRWWYD
jgi:hypothetical protein